MGEVISKHTAAEEETSKEDARRDARRRMKMNESGWMDVSGPRQL